MKVFKQNDFIKEKELADVLYEFDEKLCYDHPDLVEQHLEWGGFCDLNIFVKRRPIWPPRELPSIIEDFSFSLLVDLTQEIV